MPRMPDVLLLLCLAGAVDALYKQWIPDTNYENKTNWDKKDVPCGSDVAVFSAERKVSVFVESAHAVHEMRLPVNGEFILNPGAGFYVVSGQDPGCGAGVTTKFKDSESLEWFDPALWQAASSMADLQSGNVLFSVHEESVPCRYDDVVFKDGASFRVDTSSTQTNIPVRSVSVLGKVFHKKSEFSQYLGSRSGRLQFHGSSAVAVGELGCDDLSGCICGNTANHQQICSTVTCATVSCKKPLLPEGHCCNICGAIVTINYATNFNLQTYRDRIHNLFLTLPKYKSIHLGMSKVLKSQKLMGIVPFGTSPVIQVVILDGEDGEQAESLARDIIRDSRSHGSYIGVVKAEFQASSGSDRPGVPAGVVTGAVFGVLALIALISVLVFLVHKEVVRMPALPSLASLRSFKRRSDAGNLGGTPDLGYDNPMFDNPSMLPDIVDLYGTKNINTITLTSTGVHFVNPAYDENETDFNA
ncbi:protein amnionless [Brachionichthys hirsutus]|uniref:protein amnionless n=1 Tax=Brachionichthys hirsutus TaxID=412623 RepID=UPI003604EE2B